MNNKQLQKILKMAPAHWKELNKSEKCSKNVRLVGVYRPVTSKKIVIEDSFIEIHPGHPCYSQNSEQFVENLSRSHTISGGWHFPCGKIYYIENVRIFSFRFSIRFERFYDGFFSCIIICILRFSHGKRGDGCGLDF